VALHKTKALQKEEVPRQFFNFIRLNTMVILYNLHFANYNLDKKQITQLIPTIMWKQIYIDYQVIHLDSYIVKKTLKDKLQDILKELKIRASNEKGLEKATL
jgi:hypothetical protein